MRVRSAIVSTPSPVDSRVSLVKLSSLPDKILICVLRILKSLSLRPATFSIICPACVGIFADCDPTACRFLPGGRGGGRKTKKDKALNWRHGYQKRLAKKIVKYR